LRANAAPRRASARCRLCFHAISLVATISIDDFFTLIDISPIAIFHTPPPFSRFRRRASHFATQIIFFAFDAGFRWLITPLSMTPMPSAIMLLDAADADIFFRCAIQLIS
jgi:hypothetical protein